MPAVFFYSEVRNLIYQIDGMRKSTKSMA